MKIGMIGLGCAKNTVNTEQMIYKLQEAGHAFTATADDADIIVINTCGFIEDAKKEALETIFEMVELKKEKKVSFIVVCGCLVQRYPDSIAEELYEVDGFVGTGQFDDIVEVVERVAKGERVVHTGDNSVPLEGERVRTSPPYTAYVKIADGCDNRCAYCAIPAIRGEFHSRPMENIVQEVRNLLQDGVKEIILIAQDTTNYGKDLYGESKLCELVEKLSALEGLTWLRLLYLYPDKITDEMIDLFAKGKLLPYIEMPIQHSEQSVLHRMNRPGGRESLLTLVKKLREKIPGVTLRTTLMVGFPDESEEDFAGLCEFVRTARFDKLGVFAFSPEENTPAYDMEGQIDEATKNRRVEILENIQSEIVLQNMEQKIGKETRVVCEGFDRFAECYYGRSVAEAPDIDGKIFFTSDKPCKEGDFVTVRFTDILDFDMMGEVVQ